VPAVGILMVLHPLTLTGYGPDDQGQHAHPPERPWGCGHRALEPVRCRSTRSHWTPPHCKRPTAPRRDQTWPNRRLAESGHHDLAAPADRLHRKSALSTVTVSRDPRRDRLSQSSVHA
jgi:hypothetical protein